jgi:phage tail sheath protein FI
VDRKKTIRNTNGQGGKKMPEYLSPGVHIEEIEIGNKPIDGVSTSTAGFVGMAEKGDLDKPTLITNWSQFVDKFGRYTTKKPYLAPAVYGFFANGGSRCYVVRVKNGAKDSDYVGKDGGPGSSTGLQAFNKIDDINIIRIPGITSVTVQKAMITHCETMKDCICILDPVKDADLDAIQNQKKDVISESGYAALYYPWIKVAIETLDTSGQTRLIYSFVPPGGYIAGIYALSDMERGVHKAPANEIIHGALDVKLAITKSEQEILNPLGINCIRAFSGRGIRVWGARTTASDALWRYINVRRLFLFLEESIDKGTRWVVFEPNDEALWARVKQTITQFLITVWKDGALMGTTPEKAFFVKCDRTTMTQDDIDNGKLLILIGAASVKPAEFVIFRIAQQTGSQKY